LSIWPGKLAAHPDSYFTAWLYFNDYNPDDAVERLETFAKESVRGYLDENNVKEAAL